VVGLTILPRQIYKVGRLPRFVVASNRKEFAMPTQHDTVIQPIECTVMNFELKLLDQYWFSDSRNPDGNPDDTTSHGKISLIINGLEMSGCDDSGTEYGINQAAVQLLKSIFIDHEMDIIMPMIPHGCSIIGTCPNCIIDFTVTHLDGQNIKLGDFYVTGGKNGEDRNRYANHVCVVSLNDYIKQIVGFADKSLRFLPLEKVGEQYEIDAYMSVRRFHDKLLNLAYKYLDNHILTDEMKQIAREANCFGEIGNFTPV
jgi:hypothetical protein